MSLPSEWVEKLHSKLHVVYGDAWPRKWEGLDMQSVRDNWGRTLADLTPEAIRHGLENLPESFPPTAGQFRSIALAGTPRTEGGMKMLPGPGTRRDPERMRELLGKLQTALQDRPDSRYACLKALEAREAAGTLTMVHRQQLEALRRVTEGSDPVVTGAFTPIPKEDWPWVKRGHGPVSVSP